ncbi:hypothetical protein Tco_1217019 [Tanacetum coccineum]
METSKAPETRGGEGNGKSVAGKETRQDIKSKRNNTYNHIHPLTPVRDAAFMARSPTVVFCMQLIYALFHGRITLN